jgi:predicted outer membrane protein
MVKGHRHAVKQFTVAAKDLSDADLRAWAQTTLPLLQEHLLMAKNMETAIASNYESEGCRFNSYWARH